MYTKNETMKEKNYKLSIYELDVWGTRSDWNVNNTFLIRDDIVVPENILNSNKKLLKFLREEKILSEKSKGMLTVKNVGAEYIEICNRHNELPILSVWFQEIEN